MAWTDAARTKSAASRRAHSVTKKRWINPRSKPRTMAQRAAGVRRGASDRNKSEPYRTYGHQSDFGLYSNLKWAKSNPASSLKAHNQRRNAIKRKFNKPVTGKRAGHAVSELGDAAYPNTHLEDQQWAAKQYGGKPNDYGRNPKNGNLVNSVGKFRLGKKKGK